MKPRRKYIRLIALGLLAFGLNYVAPRMPVWVEHIYARLLYPPIGRLLSSLTSILPFSLAEALVIILPFLLLYGLIKAWRRPRLWLRYLERLFSYALLAYIGFTLLWGLNYHRQPLALSLALPLQPSTPEVLASLCADLLDRANELRQQVAEDANQVMTLPGGKWRALSRADIGYEQLARRWPIFGGRYGRPKGVQLSYWWSYTGTAGMYFPFTGEANVNMTMPDLNIPVVACHEMAHQRGFAREDEANYIAYLACSFHPDVEFQYSGVLLALTNAMRALQASDPAAYADLRTKYSPGLDRDLKANQAFWQAFAGPIERVAGQLNDVYLKSNQQADGIQSYGRMVDLLLAEYRAARGR
ncbi:MAG: DUF3810 domain-containing protein [Firmicutes bacterium]|nr:DUF3810 domain-containing protein [Bacillota bacterium]